MDWKLKVIHAGQVKEKSPVGQMTFNFFEYSKEHSALKINK